MAVSCKLTTSLQLGSKTLNNSRTIAGVDLGPVLEVDIPANQTNLQINFPIDASLVKVAYIHATQAMTLKTNSSSSPTDTINLLANAEKIAVDGVDTDLFSGDVAVVSNETTGGIFVTNTTAGKLTIAIGVDATP